MAQRHLGGYGMNRDITRLSALLADDLREMIGRVQTSPVPLQDFIRLMQSVVEHLDTVVIALRPLREDYPPDDIGQGEYLTDLNICQLRMIVSQYDYIKELKAQLKKFGVGENKL
jgi:hypothetical protein